MKKNKNNTIKKNLLKQIFILLMPIIVLILLLFIFIFPFDFILNPPPYGNLVKEMQITLKYKDTYKIYQLNTTNIFKIDENRRFHKSFETDFSHIINIDTLDSIENEKDKDIFIVSDYEGITKNNIYPKVLEYLKQNRNAQLFLINIKNTDFSKNTEHFIDHFDEELVNIIYYSRGSFSTFDIESSTSSHKLNKRPQLYLYIYSAIYENNKSKFYER